MEQGVKTNNSTPCPLFPSTHGKIRTFTIHVLSVTTPASWSTWALRGVRCEELGARTIAALTRSSVLTPRSSRQALSTRFELAIFSVTGRRELQASLRERKYPIKESNLEHHFVRVGRYHFTNRAKQRCRELNPV
jgi:hypothetical protein